jgi:uncharacterized protein YdaU (DUF1376 family)
MTEGNTPNTRNHASCVGSVAECGEGAVAFFIRANTMSKDPAVLFYTSDFLTGTMFMTDEEVGQYIRLLCAQHQKGHLHINDVLSICRTETSRVLSKFTRDQDGFYYNERMEVEIEKRRTYYESRIKNLRSHKNKGSHMASHMDAHTENENEDVSKGTKGGVGGIEIPAHLREVWPHFVEVRKKKRAPLTDRAVKNILSILAPHDHDTQLAMIEQSITRGYTGVFPVDGKTAKKPTNMPKL